MSNWLNSVVMSEFLKIADKNNLLEADLTQELEVGNHFDKNDSKTRAEKTKDYDIDINKKVMDDAHEKSFFIGKSMGDGSLVETKEQQQQKIIDILSKMPSGALLGVHAEVVNNLVKLANELEKNGFNEASLRIDKTLLNLSIKKEAIIWFLAIPAAISAGVTGLKWFGAELTSTQENFQKDLNDLYEELKDVKESKSAQKVVEVIDSILPKLNEMDMSTKEGSDKFSEFMKSLQPLVKQIGALTNNIQYDIGEAGGFFSRTWENIKSTFGFDEYKKALAKFEDLEKSYEQAIKYLTGAQVIGNKLLTQQTDKKGFSFRGKEYDNNFNELENDINSNLKNLFENGKLVNKRQINIEENGKLIVPENKLRELLVILEKN